MICAAEFRMMLEDTGFRLSPEKFKEFLEETDADGDHQISFDEFCAMVHRLEEAQKQGIACKLGEPPMLYFTAAQYEELRFQFKQVAGDDGLVDIHELGDFIAGQGLN